MKPDMKWTFEGEFIRDFRKERKITLDEIAKATGLDPANLARIEKGERRPRSDTLEKLCAVLGVQPNFFFRKEHL